MLETRKVDNNKIRKALFVSLRPVYVTVMRYLKECSVTKWLTDSKFSGK